MEKTLLIIIWIALGIHSVYYFVRSYTKSYDLTVSEIPLLILCLIVPIVTHFATWVTYAHLNNGVNNSKILFKKRIK